MQPAKEQVLYLQILKEWMLFPRSVAARVFVPRGTAPERNTMIIRRAALFFERLKVFLNKEVHIKLEQDENAVPYTLREVGKDFLLVDHGESQRIIPFNKIIFFQVGNYPKE